MLAWRPRAVGDHVRIGDERRHASVLVRAELTDHRAVGRVEVGQVAQALVVAWRRMARERVVAGRVVVLHGVVQRADHGALVHMPGHPRKVLANLNVRAGGANLPVRRTVFLRRVRLHVEDVDLARPAPLEKENDRFCPWRDLEVRHSRFRGAQQFRHRHAKEPHAPCSQQGAPRDRGLPETLAGRVSHRLRINSFAFNSPQATSSSAPRRSPAAERCFNIAVLSFADGALVKIAQ